MEDVSRGLLLGGLQALREGDAAAAQLQAMQLETCVAGEMAADPRNRLLLAELQQRCAALLSAARASPAAHEAR